MTDITYRRGIYLYKSNWVTIFLTCTDENENNITLRLVEGLAHQNAKSNEDTLKVNNNLFLLNPVTTTFDENNLMSVVDISTSGKYQASERSV